MKRSIENDLHEWAKLPIKRRKPLLIRGARQVGKTYTISKFGQENFANFVAINFEKQPKFKQCFENSLEPKNIIKNLELIANISIEITTTLLFIDEIQECPEAIKALRYFKEDMPELAVISAGSLLEFVIASKQLSMPVGRITELIMRPFSFSEFLEAKQQHIALGQLIETSFEAPPSDILHNKLLELLSEYSIVGGMPEAVVEYIETHSYVKSQQIQRDLISNYRDDFYKYGKSREFENMQLILENIPSMIGNQIKYSKISSDLQSKYIKDAIRKLQYARIIYKVTACSASGLPLIATANNKKFKLTFLDIGLLSQSLNISADILINSNNLILSKGAITEQLVGQELLALNQHDDHLYFWARDKKNASAEVDYLIVNQGTIYPVEVKSGKIGKMKSLNIYMQENKNFDNHAIGIRISTTPLQITEHPEGKIISIPIYMVSQIDRLLKKFIKKY